MTARDGLPVSVDGTRFELDVEGVTWRTVPALRPGSDQGAGPGEQSLSNEVVWRRSRDNWILGAGQEYADLIEESDVLRFRSSDGIDPWDDRALTPLQATALRRSSANTNLKCISIQVSATPYFVIVDGASVLYTLDPATGSPSFTTHTGTGATAKTSITTDGQRWWACDGTDIYGGTPGTVAATVFSTYDADVVGYANGRLLAADGAQLVEISAAGAATVIFTHPNSNFVWAGFASSPGGIYAFGNNGSEPEIYVITAIDTTGALDIPFIACDLPNGEKIRCMESYAGVMILGTSRGVRLALITGGGFLSYGPVIEDITEVRDFASRGEDVWVAGESTDLNVAAINGLTRVRLSRFTAELVPAFANDLKARGTVSGNVLTACYHEGYMYFGISGRGFYGEETATREPTSTIDLGWFTYGVSEEKLLDSLTIWCDALPASCSIVANVYAEDSVSSLLTLTMNTTGQTKETVSYAGTTKAERLRVVLTLTATATADLVVRRVTLRGTPTPFVAQLITLPLFLSDEVLSSTGQMVGQDPYTEFLVLEALVKARTRATLIIGDWTSPARLEAIEVEQGGLGGGNGLEGWADGRKFMAGVWKATFMTLEPSG